MKRLRREWIVAFIVVLLVGAIILLQFRPADGSYVVTATASDGPVSLTGAGNGTWTSASRPNLVVSTGAVVRSVVLDVNATGNGSLRALSSNGTPIVVWDSFWDTYPYSFTVEGVTVRSMEPLSVDTFDRVVRSLLLGTRVSDPHGLIDWESFLVTTPIVNTSLPYRFRSSHKFLVRASGDMYVTFEKKDLNGYNGTDVLNVTLKTLNGTVIGNATIEDDGVVANRWTGGEAEKTRVVFRDLSPSVYELDVRFSGIGDDTTYNMAVNQGPVAVLGRVHALDPANVTVYCADDCVLKAQTYHLTSLQTVFIDGDRLRLTNTSIVSYSLAAGYHSIMIPRGNVVLSGFTRATFDQLFNTYRIEPALRGDVLVLQVPAVSVNQTDFTATIPLRVQGSMILNDLTVSVS